jgi:hypothetical protein
LASSDEVLYDTLLAVLHGQNTYGAVWAILSCLQQEDHLKMERESTLIFAKMEIIY